MVGKDHSSFFLFVFAPQVRCLRRKEGAGEKRREQLAVTVYERKKDDEVFGRGKQGKENG